MSSVTTMSCGAHGGLEDSAISETGKVAEIFTTLRLGENVGMQTPLSLPHSTRYIPELRETIEQSDGIVSEPIVELYGQLFSPNSDLRVGHLSGAIALVWFTPVEQLVNAVRSAESLNSISLGLSPQFIRYTKYLVRASSVPLPTVKTALLYVIRFRRKCNVPVVGAPTSEARLLAAALMTADKYVDDVSYTTATWSKLSKIELREMKKMEAEFLKGLNFDLHISQEEWQNFEHFMQEIFSIVDLLAFR